MQVVFVHGALVRDGDWWWGPAARLLRERTGVPSRAVALPTCGEVDGVRPGTVGLADDAEALRRLLDDSGPAIVVGHSYGGTVIAEAGTHPAVEHLLYVSSYLPDAGASQAAIMSGESDPVAVEPTSDGTLRLTGYDAAAFGARFLHDADAQTVSDGWARVVPQSAAALTDPTRAAGWRGVDSTYLVCADDRSTSVALQRTHAARATRSVELPTGHHPFITRPDLVVEQLERLIGA